jgi:hypothetical protein
MAIIGQVLADGQLGNTEGDLYVATVPTFIRFFTLSNTDSSPRTVNIYVYTAANTTSRLITAKDKSISNGADPLDVINGRLLTLGIGDKIRGKADSPAKVDYVISGAT